jgi:hypothetical protein
LDVQPPSAWSWCGLALLAGCLASPPRTAHAASGWEVRSEQNDEARDVCVLFERLEPRLGALVPDWQIPSHGEIWIQEEPKLYAFPAAAKSEAEGLWAEDQGCILLARHADDVERTLAHELVHAGLGSSWKTLPGSLEEGLCDWIAARVCAQGASRLRAGRLSSAALALGGLELELELRPRERTGEANGLERLAARIVLAGEEAPLPPGAHMDVFRLQAGLSTTRLAVSRKRSFYGLSYLIVDRVTDRIGLDGLHRLCCEARDRDLTSVPAAWLLDAAGLSEDPAEWRAATLASLGENEIAEVLRMYPEFVVGALARAVELVRGGESPSAGLERLSADLALRGGNTHIDAARLEFISSAVVDCLDRRTRDQLASASSRQ